MNGSGALQTLPVWGIAAIAALIVVQLALDIWAFVDLYRRPIAQVALGNKWVWVAIIVFVNTIGAIIYLVVGRKAAPADLSGDRSATPDRTAAAMDSLYGTDREDDRP